MALRDRLKALMKNKPALAGIGAAGVLGLYVLGKRQGAGDSGGDAADEEAMLVGGGYVADPAFADTTGADLANVLGQYSADLSGQLLAYEESMSTTLEAMLDAQDLGDDDDTTGTGGTKTGTKRKRVTRDPGYWTQLGRDNTVFARNVPWHIRRKGGRGPTDLRRALARLGIRTGGQVGEDEIRRGMRRAGLGYGGKLTNRRLNQLIRRSRR